jgi:hypothetical protein
MEASHEVKVDRRRRGAALQQQQRPTGRKTSIAWWLAEMMGRGA